jgi:MFS family permease
VNRQAAEGTRAFALVAYAMLMLFVGTTLPTPLYRVYQQNLQFSSGILTLVFAVYVFTLLPSLLLVGRISDQVGRRPMLLAGMILAGLSAVLFTACRGLGWLFAARALQGVATGITTGTATAALAELELRTDVARAA